MQQWCDSESNDADSDDTETEDTAVRGIAHGVGSASGVRRAGGIGRARGIGRAGGYHRRAGRRGHTNTATLLLEPGWQITADVQSPVVRPLSQEAGPRNPLPHSAGPLEFFNQMFGVDFFVNLAAAINANAAAKRPPLQPTVDVCATSDPHWHPTSAAEVQAFVGINFAMGMADLPEYKDYWSEDAMNNFASTFTARWQLKKRRRTS